MFSSLTLKSAFQVYAKDSLEGKVQSIQDEVKHVHTMQETIRFHQVQGRSGSVAGDSKWQNASLTRIRDKVVKVARKAGKAATTVKFGLGFDGNYGNYDNDDLLPNYFSNRPDAKRPVLGAGGELKDDHEVEFIASHNASGLKWKLLGTDSANLVPLKNAMLEDALKSQTEFTQREWDSFGVNNLRMNNCILSGDSYFQPSESAESALAFALAAAKDEINDLKGRLQAAGAKSEAYEVINRYSTMSFHPFLSLSFSPSLTLSSGT